MSITKCDASENHRIPNKILSDEINTAKDICDPSASEQAKQLHIPLKNKY